MATCRIEVDPLSLRAVGEKLKTAAQVAQLIKFFDSRLGLSPRLGDETFRFALGDFARRWSYGVGCLAGDAETLGELLTQAGAVYLDVEAALAGSMS